MEHLVAVWPREIEENTLTIGAQFRSKAYVVEHRKS